MPAPLPPIDPNVEVPPAVKAAAARAEAAHSQAYNTPAPAGDPPLAPVAGDPPPAPVAGDPPPAPVAGDLPPAVTAPVTPAPDKPVDWEARYNAMKGRFDQSQQTILDLQGQVSNLGTELQQQLRAQQQQPALPQAPLVTEDDRKTFGDELIGVMERVAQGVARQAVTPLEQRTNQLGQRVQQSVAASIHAVLDAELPDWRSINSSPRFKAWCASRDIYSGGVRNALLMDAFRRGDAPRVLAFFKGFVTDEQATGQMPVSGEPAPQPPAPVAPALPLATLSTPGRPHPSGDGSPSQGDKPVFTRADIRWFYSNEGVASYYGRPDARKADEQRIFEAQREGRVR